MLNCLLLSEVKKNWKNKPNIRCKLDLKSEHKYTHTHTHNNMAAPINAADLEKLKKFIEFVAANPFVLNLPQLEFMKKFIEKFGGKVPEGEFKMPTGG